MRSNNYCFLGAVVFSTKSPKDFEEILDFIQRIEKTHYRTGPHDVKLNPGLHLFVKKIIISPVEGGSFDRKG
ncbi:MAG: hypothetical protein QXO15_02715 [Nitrososphaerota archaeon]